MSTSVACSQTQAIEGTVLFGYRVGQEFEIEGHIYRLKRTLSETKATLERVDSLKPRTITKSKLEELIRLGKVDGEFGLSCGNTKFHVDPPSEQDLEIANWRLGYVKAFLALPKEERKTRLVYQLRDQEAKARAANNDNILPPLPPRFAAALKPPSIATIYRWVQRYEPDTGPLSLLPRHFKSGRKRKKDCAAVENIIKAAVKKMTSLKTFTLSDAVVSIRHKLNELAQEDPHFASVTSIPVSGIYRRLRRYGAEFHLALARGRRYADNRFRPVMVAVHDERPLSCVEIDNTQLDVFVQIPGTQALTKPYMTMAVDVATRAVLSIHISLVAPNQDDICQVIVDMLYPKDPTMLESIGVKTNWPMHGVSSSIRIDNGKEYISTKVTKLVSALGIERVLCPPKTPRYKGVVERTFETLNDLGIHNFPGYTSGSPEKKGDARPERGPIFTLQQLKEHVLKLICDVYHTRPHGELELPPLRVWEEKTRDMVMRLPPSRQHLWFLQHSTDTKKLSRQGINIHGVTYNSYEARELLDVYGENKKVEVRWDPNDIGQVFVKNPSTNRLVELPCVSLDVRGVDSRTHELLKELSRSPTRKIDEAIYLRNRSEFNERVAELAGSRPSNMMPRGVKRSKRSKRKGTDVGRIDAQPIKIGRARKQRQSSITLIPSSFTSPPPSTKLATSNAQEVRSETDDFEIVALNKEIRYDDR
ncbi:MAG: Mu transposase C-terminal domain-containing protein [Magnetospirillum sp.]|nr:Mu transposase C-terminal domain-containing protein [Magnetospirillum sp.]